LPKTLGPFEGVNIFDISDRSNPDLVANVETLCGSHTLTIVPDLDNDRVLVYSNSSSAVAGCTGIDIIEVPIADPAAARYLRLESSGGPGDQPAHRSCHDSGVILGDEMKLSCAGGNGFTTWTLDPADGGSLTDPRFLYSAAEPGVTIGHSAGFSWDGDTLIFGHEPGGGVQAEGEATDDAVKKSYFFYDSDTGAKLGSFLLPRNQSSAENCSLHNYNVVPLRDGDDVLVHASYQAGFGVVDFNDLTNTVDVGWSDPPRSRPHPGAHAAPRSAVRSVVTGLPTGTTTSSMRAASLRASTCSGSAVHRPLCPAARAPEPEHARVHDRVAGGTPHARAGRMTRPLLADAGASRRRPPPRHPGTPSATLEHPALWNGSRLRYALLPGLSELAGTCQASGGRPADVPLVTA
jgi:hypothetical protein